MKVRKDWWKNFFNDIYLITDARSVCDDVLTRQEVNLVEGLLELDKNDRVLDMCGGHGRHSLELARRGYRDLTVLDYSSYLIRIGKRMAKNAGAKIKFICADASSSSLKTGDYSGVFIMANSFGYSPDDRENIMIIKEVHRLLKKRGRVLLDLADSAYVRKNLKPLYWHEADGDVIVCRERELKNNIIKAREVVISKKKGLLRDGYYCERIYTKKDITRILRNAGFKCIYARRNISLHRKVSDYGFMTSRMIVTAMKP